MAVAAAPPPRAIRYRELARRPTTTAVVAIVAMLGVVLLFPRPIPFGIYVENGLVYGAWAALVTLGVVLVFRTSRVINFAAFQLGATPAVLFYEAVHQHWLAHLLTGRLHAPARQLPGWAMTTEYAASASLAVGLSAGLAALAYLLVLRRLRSAPPLVGTVATVAVAALLTGGTTLALTNGFHEAAVPSGIVPPPHDIHLAVGAGTLDLGAVLTLVALVLALPAVELYLRRSRTGTAVRAAADNADRAATLGVNGAAVSVRVWALSGALSGLAAVLTVMTSGPAAVVGTGSVVPNLVAAVIGSMIGLRLSYLAALGTGVLAGGLLWSFGAGQLVNPVLLLVVVVVLLVRRRPTSRVGDEELAWQAAREIRPVPRELRGHPDVRRLRLRTAGLAAAAVALYPFLVSVGGVTTGQTVAILGMAGLSLLVLTGWAGLVSLGQFALAAVGGWVVGCLAGAHVGAIVALPLAAVAGALVAFVVGLPALRIRGLYLAILTLTFAAGVTTLLIDPAYGGGLIPASIERPRLLGLATDDARSFYFLCVAFCGLSLLAVIGLRRSRAGRALIASRENERYAELFGVRLVSARLQAFAVSGAIAALAGGLFAYQQQGVSQGNFGPTTSLEVLLIVIVGGMGSVVGPILGAAFVGVLDQFGSTASLLGLPIMVLVVLVAMPGGLASLVFRLRDLILRRIAYRHRIVVPSLIDTTHPGWLAGSKVPLSAPPSFVPERYALTRRTLSVPQVAATGKGAS